MFQFLPDLAYGGDPRHRLDLFLPEAASPPLFFFIHGGGWRGGDKQFYRPLGELLANFGYAVALANHRLAPDHGHPAAIVDVAAALACVRRYAGESGVRAEGIYLGGHSSGAHLAALLATHPVYRAEAGITPAEVAGVICISGVYELAAYEGLGADYLAPVFGRDAAAWRDASPIHHVAPGLPPFFLAFAEFDLPGAQDQAARMAAALTAAGGNARQLRVPDRNHVSILSGVQSILDPLAIGLALFLRAGR